MKYPGFTHNERTIYFIDAKGKDISFNRWRVALYYAPHYAETHFVDSEANYNRFIESKLPATYQDYNDFRADAIKEGLRDNF